MDEEFWIGALAITVLIGPLVLILVYGYISYLSYQWKHYMMRTRTREVIFKPIRERYKIYLQRSIPHYNQMNEEDKVYFEKRVQKFIDMKKFKGLGVKITDEMKVLVAATAVLITFGHPRVYFSHFWRILIYPNAYRSTQTKKKHLGEVNAAGLIVLSWKYFKEGWHEPNDGRNLGLHEMAHALQLENRIENDEFEFLDNKVVEEFNSLAKLEIEFMRSTGNEEHFFRTYGATNRHEFFAVCIEAYFERSEEFRNSRPDLYRAVSQILRFDPLQIR